MPDRILLETPFLRCIDRDGWYFVERPNATAVVALVALTPAGRLVLVEQPRVPVGGSVVGLPAGRGGGGACGVGVRRGVAGGAPARGEEDLGPPPGRELIEETGYRAGRLELLA